MFFYEFIYVYVSCFVAFLAGESETYESLQTATNIFHTVSHATIHLHVMEDERSVEYVVNVCDSSKVDFNVKENKLTGISLIIEI